MYYICRQRCLLKSSVVLLATCVMCTGGTINKSVGEGRMCSKFQVSFFVGEHPFVSGRPQSWWSLSPRVPPPPVTQCVNICRSNPILPLSQSCLYNATCVSSFAGRLEAVTTQEGSSSEVRQFGVTRGCWVAASKPPCSHEVAVQ